MKTNLNKLAFIAIVSSLAMTAYASDSHYVPGLEGVKASVLPPPGTYYRGYALSYRADKNDTLPDDSEVTVNAIANRLIWVTPKKVLGGDLALETIVPYIDTDIDIAGVDFDDQKGFGDIFFGSVVGWHGERWDVTSGLGYWAETGSFSTSRFANSGKGYDSVMFTLGSNVKLTQKGDVTFSTLGRYEMPINDESDGIKLNNEVIVEWGLGKSFGLLDVGLVGYNTFETSDGNEKRNALGASIGYFSPKYMLGGDFAAYEEYSNKDTFEGNTFRASLTKVF